MRRKVTILVGGLICLCLSMAALSCALMSDSEKRTAAREHQRPFNSPKTILSIMQNVKAAISAGVLVQESFYHEENFESYFGATVVDWRKKPTPDSRTGYLTNFAIPNPPQLINGSKLEAIIATFMYRSEPDKVIAVWSFALMASSGVDFDAIELLYGRDWQLTPPDLPSVHRTEAVATRPHGNSRIVYAGGDNRSSYQFIFGFYPDATLNTVDIVLEVRAQP